MPNRVYPRVLLSALLVFAGLRCGWGQSGIYPMDAERMTWVENTLSKMTLEEKIGQLIIPGISGRFINRTARAFEQVQSNIREHHVGGMHILGGDLAGTAILINRMQRIADIPLLITADLEGGPGYQFHGATRLPRAMAIGATGNPEFAFEAARITALEGRQLGIHVNFYPVADVNNNPRNPIINIRSFGEDVQAVTQMVRRYIDGTQQNGMVATAKHFPGHGDTSQDSHLEVPTIAANRNRLESVELQPFKAAIEAGVMAIMTGHLFVPALDDEPGLPATLSEKIMSGLLRKDLGFKGLLFTDAMNMRGITARNSNQEGAVRAFMAGSDFILYPPNVQDSFEGLLRAVKSGRLPIERLDASVRRILTVKARLNLHLSRNSDLAKVDETIGRVEHLEIAQRIIDSAITLVRDDRDLLPLKPSESMRFFHLNLLDSPNFANTPGHTLRDELRKRYKNVSAFEIRGDGGRDSIRAADTYYKRCDIVVITAFIRLTANRRAIEFPPRQVALIKKLAKGKKPLVFALFGSPFAVGSLPELPSCIFVYEYYAEAELAALKAILGEIPFQGRLPVQIPGMYPLGYALKKKS
jgi:beta-N-acetylhexosaminidase